MIARAKKAVENMKKNRKGQGQQAKDANKTAITEATQQETFFVDIGANPYISSKDTITIIDKPAEKTKEVKEPSLELNKRDSIKD